MIHRNYLEYLRGGGTQSWTAFSLLQGGKVLGCGGYACVVSYEDKVGKLNFREPMWKEQRVDGRELTLDDFMKTQEMIFKLDPTEKYFITTREIVYLSSTSSLFQEAKQKFLEVHNYDETLVEETKGLDGVEMYIQTRVEDAPPVKTWTHEQLKHLLHGVNLLHSNGLCHFDIFQKNIGFRGERGSRYPVLIDMDGAGKCELPKLKVRRDGENFVNIFGTQMDDIRQFENLVTQFNE